MSVHAEEDADPVEGAVHADRDGGVVERVLLPVVVLQGYSSEDQLLLRAACLVWDDQCWSHPESQHCIAATNLSPFSSV